MLRPAFVRQNNRPIAGAPPSSASVRRESGRRGVAACAIKTNDGTYISLGSTYDRAYRIAYPASFPLYLDGLDDRLANFDLPLGANVDRLPCGQVVLQVRTLAGPRHAVCRDGFTSFHTLRGAPLNHMWRTLQIALDRRRRCLR
jgi:hypothetical protein